MQGMGAPSVGHIDEVLAGVIIANMLEIGLLTLRSV